MNIEVALFLLLVGMFTPRVTRHTMRLLTKRSLLQRFGYMYWIGRPEDTVFWWRDGNGRLRFATFERFATTPWRPAIFVNDDRQIRRMEPEEIEEVLIGTLTEHGYDRPGVKAAYEDSINRSAVPAREESLG